MLFTSLAIVAVVLMSGCKSDEPTTNDDNPSGIPIQSTSQANVTLGGAGNFAILAGSAITSTGTTNITGDLGLSPGTSCGGFPPGILTGTQQINTVLSTQ